MPEFVSAHEAVACIPDGAFIGVNAFLTLANPQQLLGALGDRFVETGHPGELTMFCETGFGDWQEGSDCERIITSGGVKAVVLSHYATMPGTAKMVLENRIAGYNLPFGAMSHLFTTMTMDLLASMAYPATWRSWSRMPFSASMTNTATWLLSMARSALSAAYLSIDSYILPRLTSPAVSMAT